MDVFGLRKFGAGAVLGGAVLLAAGCTGSSGSSGGTAVSAPATSASAASPASAPAPASPAGASTVSPAGTGSSSSSGTPGTPASPPAPVTPTGADTYLAPGQDINAAPLHEPSCKPADCALSGDSTAFLSGMTWSTWSATNAIGTGLYKLNDCNPSCAGGHVYPVPVVITLSKPVRACDGSAARWYWSYASFTFPKGLPAALQGDNAPQNPWPFTALAAAAQQSCG